jgi:GntR family transcriptional regulator, transcriptional repressor for pyruvate dehydrogenase complex
MSAAQSPIVFEPIRQRRAFEEICERIRDQLSAGALKPGDKLPPERELAKQLGVGRSALREALRSLEIAGIVSLQKGVKGGAFIRQGDPHGMRQVVEDLVNLGSITVDELTEARIYVQNVVVRLACERASKADFEAIAKNIDKTEEMTRAGRYLDRVECSREFYRLLGAATHNQVVCMIVESITDILMKFIRVRVAAGGKPQPRLVEKRRQFLKTLIARDAEKAVREMSAHLESVHRLMKQGGRSGKNTAQSQRERATVGG